MSTQIAAENLVEGRTILVEGEVAFSRIASQYTGDELTKRIASQRERGAKYPTKVPHTTIAITNARVIPQGDQMTNEELFIHQRLYVSKSGENKGKPGYSIDDTSNFLPPVMQPDAQNPGQYAQVNPLEGELAKGLPVILVLNTFKSKDHEKRGIGLQQILSKEPIRYYSNNATAEALQAYGITIAGPVVQQSAAEANAQATNQPAAQPANTMTDPNTGLPMPAPAQAPQTPQAPAAAPGAQPQAPAAPTQAPAAQPATVQPQAPAQPQPAAGNEQYGGLTQEQYIAQLQQQVAAQQPQAPAAQPQQQPQAPAVPAAQPPQAAVGQSPFDVNQDTNAAAPSPWD